MTPLQLILGFYFGAVLATSACAQQAAASGFQGAVVQVLAKDETGKMATGSGFFAKDRGIVTAYHVVQGSATLWLVLNDGRVVNAFIEGYDPERDIAVLGLTRPAAPPAALPVADLPPNLTTRQGMVIGHPDQKRDFAIRVSFPKDSTIPATQWVSPPSGGTGLFQFASRNLELLPLDGTLNRGMSGGPVIVDGQAVAVFSGGEQASGAGLAWAIPLRYLSGVKPNDRRLPGSGLPPLSMLSAGSTQVVPLKSASTIDAAELIGTRFDLSLSVQELHGALGALRAQLAPTISACAGFGAQPATAEQWAQRVDCASRYLKLTAGGDDKFLAALNLVQQAVGQFRRGVSQATEGIGDAFENQLLTASSRDITTGHIRRVYSEGQSCLAFDAKASDTALQGFGTAFGKWGSTVVPVAQGALQRRQSGKMNTEEDIREYVRNPRLIESVSLMSVADSRMGDVQKSIRVVEDALGGCMERLTRVIDARGKLFSPQAGFDLDKATEPERVAVAGAVAGAYAFTDQFYGMCIGAASGSDRNLLEDARFRWRQRWFDALSRARKIGTTAEGRKAVQDALDQGTLLIRRSLATMSAEMRESACSSATSKGPASFDAFAGDVRMLGFARLLGVSAPVPDEGMQIAGALKAVFTRYAGMKMLRNEPFSFDEIGRFAQASTVLVINETLTREMEQCREWHPELAEGLESQWLGWTAANGRRVRSSEEQVTSYLKAVAGKTSKSPVHLRNQLIDQTSEMVRQILRDQYVRDAGESASFCRAFSQRFASAFRF